MSKKGFLYTYIAISIGFCIFLTAFSIYNILSIGNYFLICYFCPAGIILGLITFSFKFLRNEYPSPQKYFPLLVNAMTVVVAIILLSLAQTGDWSFHWNREDYSEVVELIETGKYRPNAYNYLDLPQQYAHLSRTNRVYVVSENDLTSIFFIDDYDFLDSISWGFLYVSGEGTPEINGCKQWRPMNPDYSNWFFCEYHRVY